MSGTSTVASWPTSYEEDLHQVRALHFSQTFQYMYFSQSTSVVDMPKDKQLHLSNALRLAVSRKLFRAPNIHQLQGTVVAGRTCLSKYLGGKLITLRCYTQVRHGCWKMYQRPISLCFLDHLAHISPTISLFFNSHDVSSASAELHP
jgi:hypothetical protein